MRNSQALEVVDEPRVPQVHYATIVFAGAGSQSVLVNQNMAALAPFAGTGTLTADTLHRNRKETRQRALEEFAELHAISGDAAASMPAPLRAVILSCAYDGFRIGQGAGRPPLTAAAIQARDNAMRQMPALLARYRAEAEAEGRPRRSSWAKRKAAEALQQLMQDFGDEHPPAVDTIMKWDWSI